VYVIVQFWLLAQFVFNWYTIVWTGTKYLNWFNFNCAGLFLCLKKGFSCLKNRGLVSFRGLKKNVHYFLFFYFSHPSLIFLITSILPHPSSTVLSPTYLPDNSLLAYSYAHSIYKTSPRLFKLKSRLFFLLTRTWTPYGCVCCPLSSTWPHNQIMQFAFATLAILGKKTLKLRVKLIPNFQRALAIACLSSKGQNFWGNCICTHCRVMKPFLNAAPNVKINITKLKVPLFLRKMPPISADQHSVILPCMWWGIKPHHEILQAGKPQAQNERDGKKWRTVGKLLVYCRPTVGRQYTNRLLGELFFTFSEGWKNWSKHSRTCRSYGATTEKKKIIEKHLTIFTVYLHQYNNNLLKLNQLKLFCTSSKTNCPKEKIELEHLFMRNIFFFLGFSTWLLLVCGDCPFLPLLYNVWYPRYWNTLLLYKSILFKILFHRS